MKRIVPTIAILILSNCIFNCSSDTPDNSIKGSWRVYSFQNLTAGTTELKTEENSWNKDIIVQFNYNANHNTITGTNITNQISGDFMIVGQDQFKVSNLASTYINQPRWADEFLTAILDQNLNYEITNNRLVIYYDNKTKSVTLHRD